MFRRYRRSEPNQDAIRATPMKNRGNGKRDGCEDPLEQLAAAIVADELGGIAECHDDNSQPMMYDWDVTVDGTTIALEVTRTVNGPYNAFWRAIGETNWDASGVLECSWQISCHDDSLDDVKVKKMRKQLFPLLRRLETAAATAFGARAFYDDEGGRRLPEIEVAIAALGVIDGRVVDSSPTIPLVHLGSHGGGAIGPTDVVARVEDHCALNSKKLTAAANSLNS